MQEPGRPYKTKNWQVRIIIAASLILLLGSSFAKVTERLFGSPRPAPTTAPAAILPEPTTEHKDMGTERLIFDVHNDTTNDYAIEATPSRATLPFAGQALVAGEIKRLTLKVPSQGTRNEKGSITFISAPVPGNNDTTCQEIHTVDYNLKQATSNPKPKSIKISSIHSKLDCRKNTEEEVNNPQKTI